MTTELTKAAQQALKPHQIAQLVNKLRDIAREFHAHGCLRELISREVNSALTQRPAAQTEREADTGPRVLREVFALCEDTIDKMAEENTEFSRGRAFEAKGISRAIGTWFQDEYCGRSYMGEPSLPAPQQATPATPEDIKVYDGIAAGYFADTQQATPEPVGEPVAYREKLTGRLCEPDDTHRLKFQMCYEPLFTRPAPGVPGDSELLDYLDTLATRAAGSDLHCFGGRVALYVRTGIGSQIEASGAGTAREAIRAALAAAQAKGDQP